MPPSTDDDNPFSRASAWPKMPQAPFRIGPLPKAGAPVQPPAPQPVPPQRPAGLLAMPQQREQDTSVAGFFGSGPMGGATHGAAFLRSPPKPAATLADTPASVAVPPPAAQPAPPVERERPPVELAEVEVVGRR
ncbi:MAG TPA: hypothetical protein VJS38_05970, partial [Phenylobacterium sp.]|nr:hypothetical protein [Phenylobacterium sp.]